MTEPNPPNFEISFGGDESATPQPPTDGDSALNQLRPLLRWRESRRRRRQRRLTIPSPRIPHDSAASRRVATAEPRREQSPERPIQNVAVFPRETDFDHFLSQARNDSFLRSHTITARGVRIHFMVRIPPHPRMSHAADAPAIPHHLLPPTRVPSSDDLTHDHDSLPATPPTADKQPTCIVCLERAPICAALPCAHLSFCVACSRTLGRGNTSNRRGVAASCPKCRTPVQEFKRILME